MVAQRHDRPAPSSAQLGPTLLGTLARWAAQVRFADLPKPVVELGISQIIAQIAAIRAGLQHSLGSRLVRAYGPVLQRDPRHSAATLAAVGSWLNLDDTAYAGHLAPSTVGVPLAYAATGRIDGRTLLTAVIVANECAARITAAATLGPLRGQSAMHTHLVGAVAGRFACVKAPAKCWADAMSLALAAPPWPVMHGFLGGEAKLLHVLVPVRSAMDACDGAIAGLTGPADLLEHPRGFLARFASVPVPQVVTDLLGQRWHTETLSFKLRPGGPGIDAAVDCAIALHREVDPAAIVDVEVAASVYTLFAAEQVGDYLDGPASPLSSLLLSTGYPVATALLTGDLTVADFDHPAIADPARWTLARRVRLRHDPAMTSALLESVAPFGAALLQAGERARPWLRQFVGDELAGSALPDGCGVGTDGTAQPDELPPALVSFRHAAKATPARLVVWLNDGRSVSREQMIPIGGAGPETRRSHRELVRAKFAASGGAADVAEEFEHLAEITPRRLAGLVRDALR
ncbi:MULTISPECIES: MmgE/PrpD family protein [unclassified Solwaraspora]|uniref:MmgE/PrpD family protein n=1 Tax=unclassified Solwaraspora TaxID=2627926 RepID=UPI00248C1368|nr:MULTISPECIES: MmgE/PrpD family protein [unclassified Solwaraspora]WBB95654.1 MmgE/PrpD family protein [Solwaraspora sp. WMMA2059]WBC20444.1 MmgE/PrpD family protein [Solwaraspora sp. WMMA2080]WJK37405.1 MmgE/PrpD family protein [Solwaraspora sp. WMMA2065]